MVPQNNSMADQFVRRYQAFQQSLLARMRANCLPAKSLQATGSAQETRAPEAALEEMRKLQIVKLPEQPFAPCVQDQIRAELNRCRTQAPQRLAKTIELAENLREIRLVQGVQLHSQMCLCKCETQDQN